MMIDAMDCLTHIQQIIERKDDTIYQLRVAIEQNDTKLADCILTVQSHHNIPESILIKAISKLEEQFTDTSIIIKIYQTSLDSCYYVDLAKQFADYIITNKFPKKRGEILYEKLISQFCYDFNSGDYFYQQFINFQQQLLKQANEKDRKQIETNIKQIYQRVLKIPLGKIEQFWQQFQQLEQSKTELEKQEKIYKATLEKVEALKDLERQFTLTCKSQRQEEIQSFFNILEEEFKRKSVEISKFINFYEIFSFSNCQMVPHIQERYIEILRTQSNPHVLNKQLSKLLRISPQTYQTYLLHLRTLEQINYDDDDFEIEYYSTQKYLQEGDTFKFSLEYIYRYTRLYLNRTEKLEEQQQKIRDLFTNLANVQTLSPEQKAKVYYDQARVESLLFDNKLNARAAFEKCVLLDPDNLSYWKDYFQSQISHQIESVTQRDRLRGILKRSIEVCKEEKIQAVADWLNFELLVGNVEEVYKAEERLKKAIEQEQKEEQQIVEEEEIESENEVAYNDGIYDKQHQEKEQQPQVFVDSSKTVFVKNLPKNMIEQELISLIPDCGVLECRIVKDKNKVSKGFAYVDFTSEEDAQQAVKLLQNTIINGEKIYAAISKPPKLYQDDKLTLYVDNLAYSVTTEKLQQKAGEGVAEIRIVKDEKGQPRGYAYIQYVDEQHKVKGLECLNQDPYIDGRKYFVKLSDSLEKIKQNQSNNSILIKNLPFKVRDIEIRQLFNGMNIVQINIPKNNDGRPKGFAFVEFDKQKHLKTALEMSGVEFKGRRIEIMKSDRKITHKREEKIEMEDNQEEKPKSNTDFRNLFKR